MKLRITVNLGNYENISIESSEYEGIDDCKIEVNKALRSIHEPRIDEFCNRIFKWE